MAHQIDSMSRMRSRRPSWSDNVFVWACTALVVGLSAMAAASVWAAYR